MLLDEGPSLALGHTPPDTKLHPVVQRFRSALPNDGAAAAHFRRLTLRGTLYEQNVGIGVAAQGF